jgi:hypothetical protein
MTEARSMEILCGPWRLVPFVPLALDAGYVRFGAEFERRHTTRLLRIDAAMMHRWSPRVFADFATDEYRERWSRPSLSAAL